jgi:hypothetical protein
LLLIVFSGFVSSISCFPSPPSPRGKSSTRITNSDFHPGCSWWSYQTCRKARQLHQRIRRDDWQRIWSGYSTL